MQRSVFLSFLMWFCGIALLAMTTNAPAKQDKHTELINRTFPDSTSIKKVSGTFVFEFCPDNTCDFIRAPSEVASNRLLDFGFLYVFYFSDFYALGQWRQNVEAQSFAKRLLNDTIYKECNMNAEKEKARCILRKSAKENRIKIYFARYDEKGRHLVASKIP